MPGTDHRVSRPRAPLPARGRRGLPSARACIAGLALAWATVAAGCGPQPSPYAQQPEIAHRGRLDMSPGTPRTAYPLPGSAWMRRGWPWPAALDFSARPQRLHPELARWLVTAPDSARLRVVVGLRGGLEMPRLPLEGLGAPPGSPQLAAARITIAHLLDSLRVRRRPEASSDSLWLAQEFGAVVHQSFWIVRAACVTATREGLLKLSQSNRVTDLAPAASHEPPPGEGPPTSAGLEAIGLGDGNALAGLGYDRGPLAILDTGADPTYPLLASLASGENAAPDVPSLDRWKCSSATTAAQTDPVGDAEDTGHGTFSAAILVGSDPARPEFRGATRAHLGMYRVYEDTPGTPQSSTELLVRSLQEAAGRAGVVGVQLQLLTPAEGTVANTANQIAGSGAAILAAMGDHDDDRLGSPGNARRVLGVGARDLCETARTADGQSWNRSIATLAKPELQAPTGTGMPRLEDPASTRDFDMTSGALPYATAAAFVLRNWLTDGQVHVDAGQVYAMLLACGENPTLGVSPRFPLSEGVGVVRLPAAGDVWWGCTEIGSFGRSLIPLTANRPTQHRRWRIAIWWSDPPPLFGITRHADFDLYLLHPAAPDGVVARSVTARGTFERIEGLAPKSVAGSAARSPVLLRIAGRGVGLRPTRVYWAAIASD